MIRARQPRDDERKARLILREREVRVRLLDGVAIVALGELAPLGELLRHGEHGEPLHLFRELLDGDTLGLRLDAHDDRDGAAGCEEQRDDDGNRLDGPPLEVAVFAATHPSG